MRTSLLLALIVAAPAWATGERVLISPANNPLKDSLCISMECVKGGAVHDASVTARPVPGGLELTVSSGNGEVKLVHKVATNDSGAVSSTDLLHATTVVVKAIESRRPAAPPAAPRTARLPAKKFGLVARR